jgi:tRNA modification GTPase
MIVFDTIAAECTAPYKAALSVIRMAGPDAFKILQAVVVKDVASFEPRKSYYVSVYKDKNDEKSLIDKGLVITFKGKESFAGEDSVEFYVHGSRLIVEELLEALVKHGARRAEGGEFSAKAYYNGKMDLTEAEAINQIVNARTERSKDFALKTLEGQASKQISEMKDRLVKLSAEIEVDVDYPEYDEKGTDLVQKAQELLEPLLKEADELVSSSKQSRYLFAGLKVAIVGEPNVGKSTLLNKILGEDKAIVTPIPGTTRDIVEGEKEIDGIIYKFLDTAGIRKRAGTIEKIGIEKSYEAVKDADIVLILSEKKESGEKEIQSLGIKDILKSKPYIYISTKRDLIGQNKEAELSLSKDDSSLDDLYKLIEKKLNIASGDDHGLASARDIDLLTQFRDLISSALDDIANQMTIDVIEVKIVSALNLLNEMLGVESTLDDIYDTVFKYFCIGK